MAIGSDPTGARRAPRAVLVEQADGTLGALGTPAAAAELFEQLVTQRLARRLPGGTFALLDT